MSEAEPQAAPDRASASSHQRFIGTKSFASLDGLRAISILAVLWHHTFEVPTGWRATERGFLGVDLFFVISGFLIVTLLLRERDRPPFSQVLRPGDEPALSAVPLGISLTSFYIRRFLRIFPVYYGVLIGLTVLFLTVGRNANMADAFFHDLPWAMTYTSNWVGMTTFLAITWSLSAEEQFYLVWPPVEKHLGRAVVPLLVALLVVSQLVHFGAFDAAFAACCDLSPAEPEMLKQTGFTPILLGVALAHGLHSPTWHARLAVVLGRRAMPFAAAACVLAVCTFAPVDLTGAPRLAIHLSLAVLVGSCVIREDHLALPLLRLPPLVRIGALSYGIYLFHMIARHGCKALLGNFGMPDEPWLFPLTLVVTVIIAQLSFTFYEQRFLRLKERFTH